MHDVFIRWEVSPSFVDIIIHLIQHPHHHLHHHHHHQSSRDRTPVAQAAKQRGIQLSKLMFWEPFGTQAHPRDLEHSSSAGPQAFRLETLSSRKRTPVPQYCPGAAVYIFLYIMQLIHQLINQSSN
jgi:hypothetical protein